MSQEASGELYIGEETQGGDMLVHSPNQEQKDQNSDHLEEIVTERMAEQIEDDLRTLQQKNNQTPLVFYGNIGSSYLISFKRRQLGPFIVKAIGIVLFYFLLMLFIWKVTTIERDAKEVLTLLTIIGNISFISVFFVDPGTLFEDQQETMDEDRLYCQVCKLYKYEKTKHCTFCAKCVRGYDHHCSFFGKCIGRRNYLMFGGFFLTSMAVGMGSMVSLVYTIFHSP